MWSSYFYERKLDINTDNSYEIYLNFIRMKVYEVVDLNFEMLAYGFQQTQGSIDIKVLYIESNNYAVHVYGFKRLLIFL